jgi:putative addiction module component (TIGR02574 family)
MSTVQEIEQAVRNLSRDEYGLFRDWLCEFEHDERIFELHPEWNEELKRRINDLESGVAKGIPAAQVMAEARARLRR